MFHAPIPPSPPVLATRSYDIAWLEDGAARWDVRRLPATPLLHGAVAVFGRDGHVRRVGGSMPVGDLVPGDRVEASGGRAGSSWTEVTWTGVAGFEPGADRPALWRVEPGAFGPGRPHAPVVLGGGAFVLVEGERWRPLAGAAAAFVPVGAREDGVAVTRLDPPGPVALHGLACAEQEAVLVDGLPVASWHPARAMQAGLRDAERDALARLVPQEGFGAARVPYLTMTEALDGFA